MPRPSDDASLTVFLAAGHHGHDPGRHNPERPARLDACTDALDPLGIAFESGSPASRSEVERVHSARYLDQLRSLSESGGGPVIADTYATKGTYDAALLAAGTCIEGVSRAWETGRPVFCLVRPPGHHASASAAGGYCFINNIAVAAEWAIAESSASRVAIVDFDVHHGNGTQSIFYDRSDVLYVSLHQWPWYPGSGALQESGGEEGHGFTVNIPLPAMTGDDVYLAAFDRLVVPILHRYDPDLILVSAGFDAHMDDPLGLQQVSTAGFGQMTARLKSAAAGLCQNRLVMILEGGYNLWSLAESVAGCVKTLGESQGPYDASELSRGFPYSEHALAKVADHHRQLWSLE